MKKLSIIIVAICIVISGCNNSNVSDNSMGTIKYVANGEDFVREGFLTKDGWNLNFEHVYVTLGNIKSYQTNPPYNSEEGDIVNYEVVNSLENIYTVDLAEGDENADPIIVDEREAKVGFYNAISWEILQAKEGENKGNSLVIQGTATKSEESVPFYIAFNQQCKFAGGEYIGDTRKGVVKKGEEGQLEMTFHFDHIFGDGTLPEDDSLNTGAIGFNPFYSGMKNNEIHLEADDLKEIFTEKELNDLYNIFLTLGHVGEGHCHSENLK
jgi:hypothetical protein